MGAMKRGLYVGCTIDHHRALGVHAAINAKAGELWRNEGMEGESLELYRDGEAIKNRIARRVRFYQVHSRFFRRHKARIAHLLSSYNED